MSEPSDPGGHELEWLPAEPAEPVDPTPSLPLYAPPPPTAARRSVATLFGVVVGVVALLAATTFAITALDQTDGASSPEAAVHDLFDAISHRDALGVIESLPANERGVLRDPVVDIAKQLQRLGILSSSFRLDAIPGADISVHDLRLTTSPIGKGVVAVKIVGGTITGRSIPADLPIGPTLHRIFRDDLNTSTSKSATFSSNLADSDLKLVTVEDGGGWHVSLGYTIAEAIRGDGPLPDFGAAPAPVGSATPDGVVRDLVTAAEGQDWRNVVTLMAPDEDKALYAYASLFLANSSTGTAEDTVHVSNLKLSVTGSGATRLVHVDAFEVRLDSTDQTMTMTYDGRCTTTQTTFAPGYWSSLNDSYSIDNGDMSGLTPAQQRQLRAEQRQLQAEEAQREAQLEQPQRTCPGDTPSESSPLDLGTVGALGTGSADFAVTVVQIDGRWYVSPVRTLLDTIDRALQKLTPADLDKFAKWWSGETGSSGSGTLSPGNSGTLYPGNSTGLEPIGPSTSTIPPSGGVDQGTIPGTIPTLPGEPPPSTFVPVPSTTLAPPSTTTTTTGSGSGG